MRIVYFILFFSLTLRAENIVIGIAGGSASGKSTFAEKVQNAWFPHVTIVPLDSYGIEMPLLSLEERKCFNWDSPEAVDVDLIVQHLVDLKKGFSVDQPVPNLATFSREPYTIRVNSAPIILVEGLHLLSIPKIRGILDITLFLEVDADIRLVRRIARDILKRNGDLSLLLTQYTENIKPMHDLFIQPSKQYADLVITHDQEFLLTLEKIKLLINDTEIRVRPNNRTFAITK